jgi:hypothetical protein
LLWNTPLGRSKRTRKGWNWMGHVNVLLILMTLI